MIKVHNKNPSGEDLVFNDTYIYNSYEGKILKECHSYYNDDGTMTALINDPESLVGTKVLKACQDPKGQWWFVINQPSNLKNI